MKEINLGTWHVFHPSHRRMDKWQALKVLEEAVKVVEAANSIVRAEAWQIKQIAMGRQILANEIADLLQTITNLCAAYDISEDTLSKAQEWCNCKSIERGMFEPGPRTHMHREEDDDD